MLPRSLEMEKDMQDPILFPCGATITPISTGIGTTLFETLKAAPGVWYCHKLRVAYHFLIEVPCETIEALGIAGFHVTVGNDSYLYMQGENRFLGKLTFPVFEALKQPFFPEPGTAVIFQAITAQKQPIPGETAILVFGGS